MLFVKYIHTHTYTHTHIYIHIYIYIHTYRLPSFFVAKPFVNAYVRVFALSLLFVVSLSLSLSYAQTCWRENPLEWV